MSERNDSASYCLQDQLNNKNGNKSTFADVLRTEGEWKVHKPSREWEQKQRDRLANRFVGLKGTARINQSNGQPGQNDGRSSGSSGGTSTSGTLMQKTKWHTSTDQLQVGTMVLLKDRALSPLPWLLGRLTKLYPGTDNVTRVAEIRTKKGVIRRAYNNLCPLPIT
ncbi:uncharacterized protein LOC134806324 [Cydia splendana]|uniref:uncharacterized protein LOC134806324 n=1 Tax=Cydia splendana TaxID=1100963 RepID=UPI00300C294C